MPLSQPRRAQLIITADDFGRDEAGTTAIATALGARTITAASLMANASHFDLACALARSEGLTGRIGVHLSLDEGPALSKQMAPYTDGEGRLQVRRGLRRLGRNLARAIEAELIAQIECVLATGIRPTHLDSHRHIHTSFLIGRIVVRLARRYGIPYVRPARNLAARNNLAARGYKWLFNRYVASRVRTADYFGDVVDFYHQRDKFPSTGLIECMTHLDDSPRGLQNRSLLNEPGFVAFIRDFELIGHASISR
jgi:hypothetical protein